MWEIACVNASVNVRCFRCVCVLIKLHMCMIYCNALYFSILLCNFFVYAYAHGALSPVGKWLSRILLLVEGWGCDRLVSDILGCSSGPLWAKKIN